MKLTAQLRAEIKAIETRSVQMNMEFAINLMEASRNRKIDPENKEICRPIMEELNPFKVRLENILCETDIKEQDHLLHRGDSMISVFRLSPAAS